MLFLAIFNIYKYVWIIDNLEKCVILDLCDLLTSAQSYSIYRVAALIL